MVVLLNHILTLAGAFTDGARKKPREDAPGADLPELPDRWREVLRDRLDALVRAWREPAAWVGEATVGGVTLPAELTAAVVADELVVHGWDLARAPDQPYPPDPRAGPGRAAASPSGSRTSTAARSGRRSAVPADAPPFERLLGTPAAARTGPPPEPGLGTAPQGVQEQVEQPAGLVPPGRGQGDAGQAGKHVGRRSRPPAARPRTRPRRAASSTAVSIRSRLCAYGFPPEAITALSASAIPRLVVM